MLSPGFSHGGSFLGRLRLVIFGSIFQSAERLRRLSQSFEYALGTRDLGLRKVVDQTM